MNGQYSWRVVGRATWRTGILFTVLWLVSAQQAVAQTELPQPTLNAIFPAGGQTGTSFDVDITSGVSLEAAEQLLFSHAGITAQNVMRPVDRFYPESRPIPGRFTVSIDAQVPPGVHEIRVRTPIGASNARRFVVGRRSESNEIEPNNDRATATQISPGSVINGQFERSGNDFFRFKASKGQHLVVDCVAERLDSRGDAVMALLDRNGKLLRFSQNAAGRDPVIAFTASEDATYFVRVNELSYAAETDTNASPYRLSVLQTPRVDFIDPPVATRGKKASFTLFGRNLGGKLSDVQVDGQTLEALQVEISVPRNAAFDEELLLRSPSAAIDFFAYRHASAHGPTNPIALALADGPLTKEEEPNDKFASAQEVTLPVDMLSRFDRPGDQDWYRFSARKGERLWVDVASERLGLQTDPLLVIQQVSQAGDKPATGKDVLTVDDQPKPETRTDLRMSSEDPTAVFEVPDDGEYRVMIRDQFGSSQGGPRFYYRLRIQSTRPDFRLVVTPGLRSAGARTVRQRVGPLSGIIRCGGANEFRIAVARLGGFEGTIEVQLEQPAPGLSAVPLVIRKGESCGSLIVRAAKDAKPWTGNLRIAGTAVLQDGREVRQVALCNELLWNMNNRSPTPDRLTSNCTTTVDNTLIVPLFVGLKEKKVFRMARGGTLPIEFMVSKQLDTFKSALAMSVVDLPTDRTITANTVNVAPDKPEFKLELKISTRSKAGTSSAFLLGFADVDYAQNQAYADLVKGDQTRIVKVVAEIGQELRTATRARSKATQLVTAARQKVSTATSNHTRLANATRASEQALALAATQRKGMEKKLAEATLAMEVATKKLGLADSAEAKKSAEADATRTSSVVDQQRSSLQVAEEKAMAATATMQKAAAALAAAEKVLQTAKSDKGKAELASKKAEDEEKAAKKLSERAAKEKRDIDALVNTTSRNARVQKRKVAIYSDPFVFEVVEHPFQLSLNAESMTVKAEEKVDLVASIQREFSFADEVSFKWQNPRGVSLLQLTEGNKIAKGAVSTTFKFTADKSLKPGRYVGQLQATYRFNNQSLSLSRDVHVHVN